MTNKDEYGIYSISAEQRKTIEAMREYGFKPWHSGGGCSALRKGTTDSDFWLLTVEDDPSIPNMDDKVALCHFNDEFEHDKEILADGIQDLITKMEGAPCKL